MPVKFRLLTKYGPARKNTSQDLAPRVGVLIRVRICPGRPFYQDVAKLFFLIGLASRGEIHHVKPRKDTSQNRP